MTRAALCALVGTLLSCPVRAEPPEVLVDLTHTLDERFPFIPLEGITYPFSLTPIATLARDHVAANEWHIHEHLGTQIDAPNHFIAGGRSLEMLRPDELVAPLVVIDVCAEAAHDPDFALGVADLERWERAHGRIPEHALVALDSGWSLKVANADAYLGRRADHTLHFPGFSAEAVVFLAEQRNVWGVGVDTISFDPGRDRSYAAHRALLARDNEPVTRGAYRGTFQLTPGTQADGALLADFLFDAPAPCSHEFDRVKIADGQLLLGARPSEGDLCDPARRATTLGPPLLRARTR